MTQQNVYGSDRRNLFSLDVYSVQTVHSPPKLTHERHILGMSTSARNDSHCPKLCRLSCTSIKNTLSKVQFLVVFGTCKTSAQKFGNFSTVQAHTNLRLLFPKCSKWVQNKWPKVRVVLWQKKTRFGILWWNPSGDYPFLCKCTPWPLIFISGFSHICSGLGEI